MLWRAIVVSLLGALVWAAAPAHAEPRWLTGAPLSPEGRTASAPAVAANGNGDVLAAWLVDDSGLRLQTAIRPAGGSFGAPQTHAVEGSAAAASRPDVALAGDGTAFVVWEQPAGTVRVAMRGPGGEFGGSGELIKDATTLQDLQVVANDRGDALVTWSQLVGSAGQQTFAAYRKAGGNFDGPKNASAGNGCNPVGALGAGGHAAVAFTTGCAQSAVKVARRGPDGDFGGPEPVSDAGSEPAVAIDGEGSTLVAFGTAGSLRVARSPFAGSSDQVGPDAAATSARAAALPDGRLFVAWLASGPPGSARPFIATAPKGQPFDAGQELAATDPTSELQLAVAGTGAAVVGWLRSDSFTTMQRQPDGTLLPLQTVTADGTTTPDMAADGEGNAVGGWVRESRAVFAGYDGAGPRIVDVSFPGVAEATKPTAFSFKAGDVWSPLASLSWDFGDGTTGPGPDTTHVYTKTGVITYAALAVDAAGNQSRVERLMYVFPERDRVRPVVTKFRMDRRRFRISTRTTPVSEPAAKASAAAGTRFRFTVSEPVNSALLIERVTEGRRAGKRCRKASARARGRRCKIYTSVTLLTRKHPLAGAVSIGFSGRLVATGLNGIRTSDMRLPAGKYRATLRVADAARNQSDPLRITFTITRR